MDLIYFTRKHTQYSRSKNITSSSRGM